MKLTKLQTIMLLAILVFVFYGRTFQTWFQQDEWGSLGNYTHLNKQSFLPGVAAFQKYLIPHPRASFSPLTNFSFAILVGLFKLKFTAYVVYSLLQHILNAFLIFILVNILSKDKNLATLSASLFAFMAHGQKAVTWVSAVVNTQSALTFSLIGLILLLKYLETKNSTLLFVSLVSTLSALLFKETTLGFLAMLPVYLLYLFFISKNKIYNRNAITKAFTSYIALIIIFGVFRFFGSLYGLQHRVLYEKLPETLGVTGYIIVASWAPIRAVVSAFILPNTLYSSGKIVTGLLRPDLIPGSTAFGVYSETAGIDIANVFLFIFIAAGLIVIFVKLKALSRDLFVLGLLLMLSSVIVGLLYTSRGEAALNHHFMRSRDLYLSSSGTVIILGIVFMYFYKVRKYFSVALLLIFAVYNFLYINNFVLKTEISKAKLRKPIFEQVIKTHPTVTLKTIFYFESDTSYYGSEKPSMPFQTGFGRSLLDYYVINNQLPSEFTNDYFLYIPFSQEYKEIGNYGFGYFEDFATLQKSISENNISTEALIAFRYIGVSNSLIEITSEVKDKLNHEKK